MSGTAPIALHPDNGRYFEFRGSPAVLITSAEHYGAVINPDFDYVAYLDALEACGFNKTRIFSGEYLEREEDIPSPGIHNTLVPAAGRLLAPWARSGVPGYSRGGNKFDLDVWDDRYFHRLTDFVREAGLRGIIVEFCFFCAKYKASQWEDSPLHAPNNVNGVGDVPAAAVLTLDNGRLLDHQVRLVHKIVRELRDYDNVYYEIVNEPYMEHGASDAFQNHIISAITEVESAFPHRHLIAQNIANYWAEVADPNPDVSIFNFHYAHPPKAVGMNSALHMAIAYDETGFQGTEDQPYRTAAWEFIIA